VLGNHWGHRNFPDEIQKNPRNTLGRASTRASSRNRKIIQGKIYGQISSSQWGTPYRIAHRPPACHGSTRGTIRITERTVNKRENGGPKETGRGKKNQQGGKRGKVARKSNLPRRSISAVLTHVDCRKEKGSRRFPLLGHNIERCGPD